MYTYSINSYRTLRETMQPHAGWWDLHVPYDDTRVVQLHVNSLA